MKNSTVGEPSSSGTVLLTHHLFSANVFAVNKKVSMFAE